MSIPEACQLVLQAGSMGEGQDINIVFSGLRPGEKLYEELFSDKEAYELTHHGKIRKALFRTLDDSFHGNLKNLLSLESAEPDTVVYLIKDLVPEFTHFRLKKSEEIEAQQ